MSKLININFCILKKSQRSSAEIDANEERVAVAEILYYAAKPTLPDSWASTSAKRGNVRISTIVDIPHILKILIKRDQKKALLKLKKRVDPQPPDLDEKVNINQRQYICHSGLVQEFVWILKQVQDDKIEIYNRLEL